MAGPKLFSNLPLGSLRSHFSATSFRYCHSLSQGNGAVRLISKNRLMTSVLAYLQGVLPRKSLVAVFTREGFDSKMYSFVSLQIVISIERLRTYITPVGAVLLGIGSPGI